MSNRLPRPLLTNLIIEKTLWFVLDLKETDFAASTIRKMISINPADRSDMKKVKEELEMYVSPSCVPNGNVEMYLTRGSPLPEPPS